MRDGGYEDVVSAVGTATASAPLECGGTGMLTGRGGVSEACNILSVCIVISLFYWPGISSAKADELIEDTVIQQVLGNNMCPVDSKIEGPPQPVWLSGENERDLFRLKKITGGDLRGEFCFIESLRLAPPTQTLSVLYRRQNGPWRKIEEGYSMNVLESRTNGYPDISYLEHSKAFSSNAERILVPYAWDGTKYQKKSEPIKTSGVETSPARNDSDIFLRAGLWETETTAPAFFGVALKKQECLHEAMSHPFIMNELAKQGIECEADSHVLPSSNVKCFLKKNNEKMFLHIEGVGQELIKLHLYSVDAGGNTVSLLRQVTRYIGKC